MALRYEYDLSEKTLASVFLENNISLAKLLIDETGIDGVAVWLTARYLQKFFLVNKKTVEQLKIIEEEVEGVNCGSVALLESGVYLGRIMGESCLEAISQLENEVTDSELKESLQTLRMVVLIDWKGVNNTSFG